MDAGDDRRSVPYDPESKGCLLIVAGYADVAQAVEPVVAEAASRIMMSPTLGDFMEVRFVDSGARPLQPDQVGIAVARIADELTRPGSGATQSYFALMVVDGSAAAVEQVLGDCLPNPMIAALPLRGRGVAAVDDRQHGAESADGPSLADVTISPSGAWTADELIDELRRYAEDLLGDFGTSYEPGLTQDQLVLLRSSNEKSQIAEPANVDNGREREPRSAVPLALGPASPPEEASPAEQPPPPEPAPASAAASSATSQRGVSSRSWMPRLRRGRSAEPATAEPATAEPATGRPAAGSPATTEIAAKGSAAGGPAVAGPAAGDPLTGEAGRPTAALAFLVLIGDDSSDDRTTWHRGRSLLLAVDQKIAAAPQQACYLVRAMQTTEGAAKSTLRQAGQLSRRDLKRSTSPVDFARSLADVQTALRRDLEGLARSAMPAARPAIVLFSVDAPLADAITAQVYDELAREAFLIWVVPERSADLMSPVFAAGDTRILTDHHEAADEVSNLLRSNTAAGFPLTTDVRPHPT